MTSLLKEQIREIEETTSETSAEVATKSRSNGARMLIIALSSNPTISPTAQQDHRLQESNLTTWELKSSQR